MNTINIVNGPINSPVLIHGHMRMPALSKEEASEVLKCAVDLGINFFDNATCYTAGEAEIRFGEAFKLSGIGRDKVIVQTKCGLCFDRGCFDWSKKTILESVDDSLRRMQLDELDVLLLHRPDIIFEPEEVAEAFDILYQSGKVKYFGVSNLPPLQIDLLKKFVKQPIIFNQLQLSLEQSQLIDQALYLNNKTTDFSYDRDNGTMDYCRLHDITVQAWSPIQYGFNAGGFPGGCFIDDPGYPELNKALAEVGETHGVSKTAVALAWVLRHPCKPQAIVGTMNKDHLKESADACKVNMSREEWYKLYLASGKYLP